MNSSIRRRSALAAFAAATLALALALANPTASAQGANPNAGKPMRVILPVGAGSGVDGIVRAAGPALGKALGQPVIIENLPGAGGITGTTALVKAAPDGTTLGVLSNNHVVNPSVFKKLPFDALVDITPISVVGETPFALVVNPAKVTAKNAKELQALLKSKPGTFNYASSGNGTIIHLAGEMVVDAMQVDVKHIPYKGVGPQIADLIGGQVEMGVVAVPAIVAHVRSGALRAIGVMGKARVASLPDVPTIAEQGFPEVDIAGWFAVVGPAKLPPSEVKRIHAAVAAAFADPEVKQAMAKQDNVIHPSTPEAAAQFFRSEQERYARLVKKAGITLE
jgi:tripartite-type tricarboxylate transporter receptor subunit TctC